MRFRERMRWPEILDIVVQVDSPESKVLYISQTIPILCIKFTPGIRGSVVHLRKGK